MTQALQPGSTIGILGGGQLGRMLAMAAHSLGYRVVGFTPEENSPLSEVCGETICAAYDDKAALERFAKTIDVVTIEFENIPTETLSFLEQFVPARPRPSVLSVAQNRLREKTFLSEKGFAVAPFMSIESESQLTAACDHIGIPAVLKTAGFGYDGKGQRVIREPEHADAAWHELGGEQIVFEEFIPFEMELSVIGARSIFGEFAAYGPIENTHRNHILDTSTVPTSLSWIVTDEAMDVTRKVMEALDVVGLLCVEFFYTIQETLLINEIAPRPHNSGHFSIDACATSQFEQHVRAICGLPLGKTHVDDGAAMANLLGDLWNDGEPNWAAALAMEGEVHLHLYGKKEPRPGRKMGHITARAKWAEEARELARNARAALTTHHPA